MYISLKNCRESAEMISASKAFASFIAIEVLPMAVAPTTQISNGCFEDIMFLRGFSGLILRHICGNILHHPYVFVLHSLDTLAY